MESVKSLVVAAILIIIIIAGGIFFYNRGNTSNKSNIIKPVVSVKSNNKLDRTTRTPQSNQPTIPSGEIDIMITKNGFTPSTVVIKNGTKVKWINASGIMVALYSYPKGSYPAIDFGRFTNGSSVEAVFDSLGVYHYYNSNNINSTGNITVR